MGYDGVIEYDDNPKQNNEDDAEWILVKTKHVLMGTLEKWIQQIFSFLR